MSYPNKVARGIVISDAVQLLKRMYTDLDLTSSKGVASSISTRSVVFTDGWKNAKLWFSVDFLHIEVDWDPLCKGWEYAVIYI